MAWEMWKSAAAGVEVKSEVSEGFRTSLVERCVWALDLPRDPADAHTQRSCPDLARHLSMQRMVGAFPDCLISFQKLLTTVWTLATALNQKVEE